MRLTISGKPSATATLHACRLLDVDADFAAQGFAAGSADLVLAGCAILQAIRNVWPAQRLRVADRGLREGLLTEMMAADGVWRRGHHRRGRPDTAPKPRPAGGPGERR